MSDAKIKISVEDQQAITALNKLGNSFASVGSKATVGMNQASTATEKAGGSAQLMGSRLSETIKSFIAFEFAKKIVQTADATMRAAETMEGLSAATYKSAESYVELTGQAKASFDQLLLGLAPFMSSLAEYASEGLGYWARIFGVDPEANSRAQQEAQYARVTAEANARKTLDAIKRMTEKYDASTTEQQRSMRKRSIDALTAQYNEQMEVAEKYRKEEAEAKGAMAEDDIARKKALDKKNEAANKAASDKRKSEQQAAEAQRIANLWYWADQFIAVQVAEEKAVSDKFDADMAASDAWKDHIAQNNALVASDNAKVRSDELAADIEAHNKRVEIDKQYRTLRAENSRDLIAIENERYKQDIEAYRHNEDAKALLAEKAVQHNRRVAEIERQRLEDIGAATAQLFGSVASLIADGDMKNKKRRLEYKTAALAEIAINTAVGFSKALAMNGPVGVITGAAVLVSGAAQAERVRSQKFATGGIVQGPRSGDQVPVRANGGEMILTQQQQSNLFALANGQNSGGMTIHYSPTISGGSVVGMRQMLQENHAEFVKYVKQAVSDPSFQRQQRSL